MNNLSPRRRRVILVCCCVACMSSGPVLLRNHLILMGAWILIMFSMLAYAIFEFFKLSREARGNCR